MKASEYPVSSIPETLKQHDQWVAWKEIARDGCPTKVPIDVHSGQFASVSDSTTWSSFDEAMEFLEQQPDLKGLGFVFTADDPFAGVDLDDCLDAYGEFVWGKNVVAGLGSYTEVSPSGRGVKVFLQGKKHRRPASGRTLSRGRSDRSDEGQPAR